MENTDDEVFETMPPVEEHVHTRSRKHLIKRFKPLLGLGLILAAIVGVVAVGKNTLDNRNMASTGSGTVTLGFNPGSSYVAPNTQKTIQLQTNTGFEQIFGYEIVIDFTGTVPTDFVYTPASVAGISTAPDPTDTPLVFVPTATGKRLSFGLLTPISPRTAFSTNNGTVTVGSISFTAPASGSMKVAIEPQLSRAIRFNATSTDTTETDVLKTPTDVVYTFGSAPTIAPTPTPMASVPPSSTPTPTPVGGLTDTVAPTVQLTFPVTGATVLKGASLTLAATASDDTKVSRVDFLVNNSLVSRCSDTTAPYTCKWKVPGKRPATYVITAKAYDAAGNTSSSSTTVNVQ